MGTRRASVSEPGAMAIHREKKARYGRVLPFRPVAQDPITLHPGWLCLACPKALQCPEECGAALAAGAAFARALGAEAEQQSLDALDGKRLVFLGHSIK